MQISGGRREEPSSSRNEPEVDAQPSPSEVQQTRKITIQLSECIFQRLEAATDRPGMGKSVVVEAALERFLDPAPRIEGLVYEAIERTNKQVLSLRTDIAVIAETVALHVRYHLTLTPPMPPSKQDEACDWGSSASRLLPSRSIVAYGLAGPCCRRQLIAREVPADLGLKWAADRHAPFHERQLKKKPTAWPS